ncbi:unnamed protein product [Ostreobium quekettii]|uniref:Uncharacterized protein n=1 Tax=Ostreobium quekettii TaxID=121088 RepID=A0A8S1JDD3_9CHLO|nr:unnamed protein product [Ostreobium quekettii]
MRTRFAWTLMMYGEKHWPPWNLYSNWALLVRLIGGLSGRTRNATEESVPYNCWRITTMARCVVNCRPCCLAVCVCIATLLGNRSTYPQCATVCSPPVRLAADARIPVSAAFRPTGDKDQEINTMSTTGLHLSVRVAHCKSITSWQAQPNRYLTSHSGTGSLTIFQFNMSIKKSRNIACEGQAVPVIFFRSRQAVSVICSMAHKGTSRS